MNVPFLCIHLFSSWKMVRVSKLSKIGMLHLADEQNPDGPWIAFTSTPFDCVKG